MLGTLLILKSVVLSDLLVLSMMTSTAFLKRRESITCAMWCIVLLRIKLLKNRHGFSLFRFSEFLKYRRTHIKREYNDMWWAYWASSFWRSSDSISTFFYYSLNLLYIHVFRRCCQIVVRLSRLSINQCFPRQGTPSIKEKPKFWDLEDGVPISTILQISASAFQQFWGMRWGARDKQMHSLVKPRQSHIISLSVLLFCFSPSPAFLMAIEFVEFTPLLTHTRVQSLSAQSGLFLVITVSSRVLMCEAVSIFSFIFWRSFPWAVRSMSVSNWQRPHELHYSGLDLVPPFW